MQMANEDTNVEQQFLERMKNRYVKVFLTSGIALSGVLTGHDEYTILILKEGETDPSLVYKEHISTVLPSTPTQGQRK